jgi:predicted enzyme related to lactoylglutathione lyase
MGRLVHFELNVKNPEKEIEFYQNVFEWHFQNWSDGKQNYWLINTGEETKIGINGGLSNAGDRFPSVVNTIEVENLKGTIEKIKSNGGTIITEIITIPNVGLLAYFKDVEGVIQGILEGITESDE